MSHQKINNLAYLKEKRKQLRNNATPAETRLWLALKNSALHNRKFRRQHSIGNYIVDFYCPGEKLVIELDGEVHNDPLRSIYDAEREQRLRALGCKVLRFENSLVFTQLEHVLFAIAAQFKRD